MEYLDKVLGVKVTYDDVEFKHLPNFIATRYRLQMVSMCYPAFYLVLNHTTFSQIKKGHSINYSDGFYIGLLYAVPLVIS